MSLSHAEAAESTTLDVVMFMTTLDHLLFRNVRLALLRGCHLGTFIPSFCSLLLSRCHQHIPCSYTPVSRRPSHLKSEAHPPLVAADEDLVYKHVVVCRPDVAASEKLLASADRQTRSRDRRACIQIEGGLSTSVYALVRSCMHSTYIHNLTYFAKTQQTIATQK